MANRNLYTSLGTALLGAVNGGSTVWATILKERFYGPRRVPIETWNPSDKSANIQLQNNNLTIYDTNQGSGPAAVRSTTSKSTGKYQIDILVTRVPTVYDGYGRFGLANSTASLAQVVGSNVNSFAVNWDNSIGNSVRVENGTEVDVGQNAPTFGTWPEKTTPWDRLSLIIDFDAKKFVWAVNGIFRGNGSGVTFNPTTMAGAFTYTLTGPLFAMVSSGRDGTIELDPYPEILYGDAFPWDQLVATTNVTLDAATTTSAATLSIIGTDTSTLADATISSTGTVSSAGISGVTNVTLDAATTTSAATLSIIGTDTSTLAAATTTSAAILTIVGTETSTLTAATTTSAATLSISAVFTNTLAAATTTSAATVSIVGSAAQTLAAATLSSQGFFTQLISPNADISSGSWFANSGTLASNIDETTVDDVDYIYASNPGTFTVSLPTIGDPGTDSGFVLNYRAKSSGGTQDLIVRLLQGATVIASETRNDIPITLTTYAFPIASTDIANITDFSNLRLQMELI